jgi:methylated-DNA-[protein]-cysteine S-methyltransferase
MTMKFNRSTLHSPLGELVLVTDAQQQLRALQFSDRNAQLQRSLQAHYGSTELVDVDAPSGIAEALRRYFEGDLVAIDEIDVATVGDGLQRNVWAALRRIPVGRTSSYGELARALGYDDPRAAIDIGAANGANPIAIVIPCHRVVGKNGDLKGYAWGPHRKRWLLEHEHALAAKREPAEPSTARLPGF